MTPLISFAVSQEQLAQLYNTWSKFADAAGGVQLKEFVQVRACVFSHPPFKVSAK